MTVKQATRYGLVDEEKSVYRIQNSWMVRNKNFLLPGDPTTNILVVIGLQQLKDRWTKANACFENETVVRAWWNKICDRYCEPTRAYHTLLHIEELFGYVDIVCLNQNSQAHQVLSLAIFFHDIVYDAKSCTNEEDSAKLFRKYAEEVGSAVNAANPRLVDRVVEFILATKTHELPPSAAKYDEEHHTAMELFLDFDLAVLGKDMDAYDAYTGLIRKEYSTIPRHLYCEERAEVLETFLDGGSGIFKTPIMKEALEISARCNLRREVMMLKDQEIPCEQRPAS